MSALTRLAKRFVTSPDGEPARRSAGVPSVRQATVSAVAATTVDVLIAGDTEAATCGWIGVRPAVGDTVWVDLLSGHGIVRGVQQQTRRDQGDTGSVSTDASADITVSHTLGVAPTRVRVQDHSSLSSFARSAQVHTVGSSTFKVRCWYNNAQSPSTAGWAFYWWAEA